MNRTEFFRILISELRDIQASELQDVLQYYNEYFDDAGAENEQSVLEELGSPQKIAAAIRETSTLNYITSGQAGPKRSLNALWVTLIAIFALPVGLPLALSLFAVIFSLVLVWATVILCFFILAFSLTVSGFLCAIASFLVIPSSIPTFIFILGSGLALCGLGILFFVPSIALARLSFKSIMLFINHKILRRG